MEANQKLLYLHGGPDLFIFGCWLRLKKVKKRIVSKEFTIKRWPVH